MAHQVAVHTGCVIRSMHYGGARGEANYPSSGALAAVSPACITAGAWTMSPRAFCARGVERSGRGWLAV